jgi:general stress protein 26
MKNQTSFPLADWPTGSELMDRVKTGILSVPGGSLRAARRFSLLEEYPQDCLWLVTRNDLLGWFNKRRDATLSFVDEASQRELVVTGELQPVGEQTLLIDLWDDAARASFPNGLKDPQVSLVKFFVESSRDTVWCEGQRAAELAMARQRRFTPRERTPATAMPTRRPSFPARPALAGSSMAW